MSIHNTSVLDEQDETCGIGCHAGLRDEPPAEDAGGGEQELPGSEWWDMASLRRTIQATAARIEAECGGTCVIHAMVSSDDSGAGGFLVRIEVDGESGSGNAASLDDAELQARLDVSVKLATKRRKAVTCG